MILRNTPNLLLKIFIPAVFLFVTNVHSQNTQTDKSVLQPPMEQLIAVHFPELDGVEKDVSEQIISFQESLIKTAKTSPITRKKLSDSYGVLGEIYHAYAMLEPAKECYTNAYRLMPDDFKWLHLLGKLSQEQNKFYDAIDYYQKSQKLRPEYIATSVNLGNVYLELDLLDIAKENFEKVLKISKDNPAALYGLGQIEYSKRNFQNAVTYFEQVIKLLPEANRVHYSLATAYRGLNNIEQAKLHLAQQGTVGVRISDPLFDSLNELKQGIRLRLLRGKLAFEAQQFEEAQTEFGKVLLTEPNNITALVNLGATFVKLGKGIEAIKQFEKVIEIEPNNVNARYNLAVLLALQNKHFQAIGQLKEIIKLNPKDLETRFLLAKELRNADLLQESLSEFAIVFEANPDNENVVIEVIKLLIQKGDYKQAKDILEKSYAKFPERNRTATNLAYLLATSPQKDLRDGNKALEIAQKVYLKTQAIEYGTIVSNAYAELGRCEDAVKFTQQLLEKTDQTKNPNLFNKIKDDLEKYRSKDFCIEKNK